MGNAFSIFALPHMGTISGLVRPPFQMGDHNSFPSGDGQFAKWGWSPGLLVVLCSSLQEESNLT